MNYRTGLVNLCLLVVALGIGCQEPTGEPLNVEATVEAKVVATVVAFRLRIPNTTEQPSSTRTPTVTPSQIPVIIPTLAPTAEPPVTPLPTPTAMSASLPQMVSQAVGAVVAVHTPAGTGSGFFFEDGLVMTNAHVVGDFLKATVVSKFSGMNLGITGDVIGVDEDFDVAVIQVGRNSDRPTLRFGDSGSSQLAEDVVVIGFPLSDILGESISVSGGIISSKRNIDGVEMIQTDAAINPGNSGGPLLNARGEVIGMATLKPRDVITGLLFEGTGIAIASETIVERLELLLDD